MITIQTQNFGTEIEMTGITRSTAAKVIAKYFETTSTFIGGSYDTYGALDRKGRMWKAMSDRSISAERKKNGEIVNASPNYRCELVTPVLQYEDIEDLQNIIRALVKRGAIVNRSCGMHVHVDGANHTAESLVRLLNFAVGRQDLFNEALENKVRLHWCQNTSAKLLKALKDDSEKTLDSLKRIWYSSVNDDYVGGVDTHSHYNSTRYHGINLHAFFSKGTVEFRLFNSTLHAGKIKAYIQFCLAMSAWAINANNNLYFKYCGSYTQEQKEKLMKGVLKRRLGMSGPEFKTARLHLTAAFRTEEQEQTTEEEATA